MNSPIDLRDITMDSSFLFISISISIFIFTFIFMHGVPSGPYISCLYRRYLGTPSFCLTLTLTLTLVLGKDVGKK
jgi:hypothetical protein